MSRYNKLLMKDFTLTIGNKEIVCEVYNSECSKYYDVHIIHPSFRDDEMNTLQEQIPNEHMRGKFFDKEFFLTKIFEFVLWHELYGEKGIPRVNIEIEYDSLI